MRKLIPVKYSKIMNPHVFSLKKKQPQKAKGYISGYEQKMVPSGPAEGPGSNEERQ